jgi:plastocyanin
MLRAINTFIIVKLNAAEVIAVTLCTFFSVYFLIVVPFASAQISYIQLQENTIYIVAGASNPGNRIFFNPSSTSINVGTLVKWINNDNTIHTVTFATPGIYDSGIIAAHGSVSHSFYDQGVFDYFCRLHPFMTANITIS